MKKFAAGLLIICISTVAYASSISLVYDGNMIPDPNTEITVYVHSDTPLYTMDVYITITGDANVTAAMNPADCNQYGFDPAWAVDPYLDTDGYGEVDFGGVAWPSQTSGTVGYFKFIYNGGQVTVSFILDEGTSGAFSADCEMVPFSTDTLTFGVEDQNSQYYGGEDFGSFFFEQEQEGSQQLDSGGGGGRFYFCPELTFDDIINFRDFAKLATNWQQSGTGLAGDFDGSETVDFNDLVNMAYYWLQPVNWPVEVLSDIASSVTVTNPVDLAIATDSNVYVLSSSQHQVKIYNNQLQLQSTLDVNAINPRGLAVDANNHIYIADTGNNRILKCEPNGTLDTNFGASGSGDVQFSQPQGIAIDWNGKIYVADSNNNRVQIFEPNGAFVAKWGQFGVSDGNLSNPSGMCLLGNSELFVADTNNNRIQRLGAASGYFLSKVGLPGSGYTQFNAPGDVCYDIAFDQIIVADSNNNRLQIFQLHSYGGNSSSEMTFAKAISDQNFLNPMAVACKYDPNDPNQIIFVADTGNNRILKLRIQNNQQDNSPLGIFDTFKAALDANNVNAAIDCFTDTAKEIYSIVLPQLQSKFSEMVADMGEMILISRDENKAVYDLLREEDGQMFGYPVVFSRDEMGNWKISKF